MSGGKYWGGLSADATHIMDELLEVEVRTYGRGFRDCKFRIYIDGISKVVGMDGLYMDGLSEVEVRIYGRGLRGCKSVYIEGISKVVGPYIYGWAFRSRKSSYCWAFISCK